MDLASVQHENESQLFFFLLARGSESFDFPTIRTGLDFAAQFTPLLSPARARAWPLLKGDTRYTLRRHNPYDTKRNHVLPVRTRGSKFVGHHLVNRVTGAR
jgi:hypothetical protein